jgi:1,4-alpha-glucan branching enzyme
MPIYPRGGGINSPYAAIDFQQTNPAYGTISDLKDFVSQAHDLNMEEWLDWVPNHTATDATWVTTHPEYYVKSGNGIMHPNNYGDVYQLDYSNADLCKAMTDCLKFWIDQTDIDGYRCDYISSSYIPASYWQTTIPEIKGYKRGKTITFLGEANIAGDATRLKTVGFDYDYAWSFQTSLVRFGASCVYTASLKTNVDKLITAQSDISFGRMVYLTNHDQNFNEREKTLTDKYGDNRYPLTVLVGTAWGMPLIYNGQEVGGNQALDYFHDTKIDWTNPDTKMYHTLRTLSALKHAVPAFQDGATIDAHHTLTWLTANSQNVLAYTCQYGDSEALVVLNFGTTAVCASVSGITAGDWSLWLDSQTISQGVSRKQVTLSETNDFELEAKGYQVYVKGSFSEEKLGEEPTNLSHVQRRYIPNDTIYSLSGRAMDHCSLMPSGIYIQNGRKIIYRKRGQDNRL